MKDVNMNSKSLDEKSEEIIPFPYVLAECVTELLYDNRKESLPAKVDTGRTFVSSLGFLIR